MPVQKVELLSKGELLLLSSVTLLFGYFCKRINVLRQKYGTTFHRTCHARTHHYTDEIRPD